MKLFIYEHITSGALSNEVLPASLEREGNMMLHAIIDDFIQLDDIELIILRDHRLEAINIINPAIECTFVDNEHAFQQAYQQAIKLADYILPIAPETDNILCDIQNFIQAEGKQLLGCQPTATAISTDKYLCYQSLNSHSIPTPKTLLASEWSLSRFGPTHGYVLKPRDGAGSLDTQFFPDKSALENCLNNSQVDLSQFVIQPYIAGTPISLSILCNETSATVLAINNQHISLQDNAFSFLGCTVNGADLSAEQATSISQTIHSAIDGLWGFIGIDAIVSEDNIVIIDINPRLTTSYIGLHESLQTNPAQLLLSMMKTNSVPPIPHRQPVEILL